jgi:hypothetical protein
MLRDQFAGAGLWPISVDLAIEVAGKKENGDQRHTECKPASRKPVRPYQNSEDDRGYGGRKNRITVSARDFHRGECRLSGKFTATELRLRLAASWPETLPAKDRFVALTYHAVFGIAALRHA